MHRHKHLTTPALCLFAAALASPGRAEWQCKATTELASLDDSRFYAADEKTTGGSAGATTDGEMAHGPSVKADIGEGSTYIPVDSWIYPAMSRLYTRGYAESMFLGMRPWTRQSVTHILDMAEQDVLSGDDVEAQEILLSLRRELRAEESNGIPGRSRVYGTDTVYGRLMGVTGTPLRDSFHLGQSIANDYGRPYESGFNSILGISTLAEAGRFSFYLRAEYQHSPAATGYSQSLSAALSSLDGITYSGFNLNQATIPSGPVAAQNPFRIEEATVSAHIAGHEISLGKSDAWLGPSQGGAMAWSNNAEGIYSFRVNRVEPLYIPLFSRLFGPMRYDFFYGSLKGHTAPNNPWIHSEIFSLRPTRNFEFAFQRSVIFGGRGHEPVTLHTFLRSFFSISDTTEAEKYSAQDPGARFSDFSFSYRLPLLRKYATLYADSISHDDVSPISAPRRAAYRTGLYIARLPALPRVDVRVEAVTTDPGVHRSVGGRFNYYESIQQQGYTNKGFIMGDWIGREAKGGQAWLTYHLSGNEWVQIAYLNKKTPKDFVAGVYSPVTNAYGSGGTTQNEEKIEVVKRFLHDNLELDGWFQHEGWKAPLYLPGLRNDNIITFGATYHPGLRSSPSK